MLLLSCTLLFDTVKLCSLPDTARISLQPVWQFEIVLPLTVMLVITWAASSPRTRIPCALPLLAAVCTMLWTLMLRIWMLLPAVEYDCTKMPHGPKELELDDPLRTSKPMTLI